MFRRNELKGFYSRNVKRMNDKQIGNTIKELKEIIILLEKQNTNVRRAS